MIRQQISNERRQKLLSGYLDGSLTPEEQKQFEALMQSSPALRKDVHEQAQARHVLRHMPLRKPRHNFTLTRAEAQAAKRGLWMKPVSAWASLLCSLLLVVVMVGRIALPTGDLQTGVSEASLSRDVPAPAVATGVEANRNVVLLNWVPSGIGGSRHEENSKALVFNTLTAQEPQAKFALSSVEQSAVEFSDSLSVENTAPPSDLARDLPSDKDQFAENLPIAQSLPTETPDLGETGVTRSNPPLIFGFQDEGAGTVLASYPNISVETTDTSDSSASRPIERILPRILAILALNFGLIWFVLKHHFR